MFFKVNFLFPNNGFVFGEGLEFVTTSESISEQDAEELLSSPEDKQLIQ